MEYYARFFDVDTSQVVERCLKTLYPVGDFANDTLNNQPDLYGPFWISTTVIFALYVCSSLAGSVVAYINNEEYVYDFRLLSFALVVVYLYSFLCPVIVWAATKYYGCQPSLLEIVDYYGYAMTTWVPVSVCKFYSGVVGQKNILIIFVIKLISFCALSRSTLHVGCLLALLLV